MKLNDNSNLNKTTPLLEKTYEINLRIYGYVSKFPRAQKPVLGNKLLEIANLVLEKAIEVVYAKGIQKEELLKEIDIVLKKLMLFLRFSKDLALLSYKGYEYLGREITEMGKMVGGWQKWEVKKKGNSRKGVLFTMESPLIKKYLELKVKYPQNIIALKVGVFYKLFFEDARYFQKHYKFMLRNLAAPSSPVPIESCGFPISNLSKYKEEIENLKLFD